MNKKIKQLARQAELDFIKPSGMFSAYALRHQEKTYEKFAQLIVNECAELVGCNGHVSGFELADLLKKHFGFEQPEQ